MNAAQITVLVVVTVALVAMLVASLYAWPTKH